MPVNAHTVIAAGKRDGRSGNGGAVAIICRQPCGKFEQAAKLSCVFGGVGGHWSGDTGLPLAGQKVDKIGRLRFDTAAEFGDKFAVLYRKTLCELLCRLAIKPGHRPGRRYLVFKRREITVSAGGNQRSFGVERPTRQHEAARQRNMRPDKPRLRRDRSLCQLDRLRSLFLRGVPICSTRKQNHVARIGVERAGEFLLRLRSFTRLKKCEDQSGLGGKMCLVAGKDFAVKARRLVRSAECPFHLGEAPTRRHRSRIDLQCLGIRRR